MTSKDFIARITAFIGKREISRYNADERSSSYRLLHILNDVQRYARYNAEDAGAYGLMAYGIGWAYETGRINGATAIALKAMTCRDLFCLIHKVHTHCTAIGEIPAYMMGLNLQSAA